MIKKQSKSEIDSQKMLSKGTFKTNSQHNLIGDSFAEYQLESKPNSACTFCIYKPTIINKLKLLKEIIQEKNEKIRELQSIIYTITNMALGKENEGVTQTKIGKQLDNSNRCQRYWQKLQDMQELSFSQNKFHRIKDSRQIVQEQMPGTTSRDLSLVSSQVNSEKEVNQQINMRVQIKKQIKNMDLQKKMNDNRHSTKETDLKKKLFQIINILPSNKRQNLKDFETLSEPHNEGPTGLVNSNVSNHKRVRNVGFLKKVQSQEQYPQKNSNSASNSNFFFQSMRTDKNT